MALTLDHLKTIGLDVYEGTAFAMSLKETVPFEKPAAEASCTLSKYPERAPVICEKAPRTNLPEIEKKKFLVPRRAEGDVMNEEEEMCLPPAYMGEEAMMMAGMGYDAQEMAHDGEPCHRVYVRGFDFGTTEEALKEHFGQAGPVTSVELWGRGAAAVTFASAEAAQAALSLHRSTVPGNKRFVEVKLDDDPSAGKPGSKVLVRGFDFGTTDEQLQEHCSKAGTIASLQWVSKASALLTYSTPAEAENAAKILNRTTIEGNKRFIDVMQKDDNFDPSWMMMTIMEDPMSGCAWPMCMPMDMSKAHMREDMAQCEMMATEGQLLMDAGDGTTPSEVDATSVQDPATMEALCCNMEADGSMMPEETLNWAMLEQIGEKAERVVESFEKVEDKMESRSDDAEHEESTSPGQGSRELPTLLGSPRWPCSPQMQPVEVPVKQAYKPWPMPSREREVALACASLSESVQAGDSFWFERIVAQLKTVLQEQSQALRLPEEAALPGTALPAAPAVPASSLTAGRAPAIGYSAQAAPPAEAYLQAFGFAPAQAQSEEEDPAWETAAISTLSELQESVRRMEETRPSSIDDKIIVERLDALDKRLEEEIGTLNEALRKEVRNLGNRLDSAVASVRAAQEAAMNQGKDQLRQIEQLLRHVLEAPDRVAPADFAELKERVKQVEVKISAGLGASFISGGDAAEEPVHVSGTE